MQNKQIHTLFQEAQPLVSFIITCYNLPMQMLCECINSILDLSLSESEREIIIVDDGSETSPINGLTQYGSEIIYVRQQHLGVSVARNNALRMAHGQFIQFVDGDDCLLKEPYNHCLDLIQNCQQPIDVVMFDFTKTLPSKDKESFHDSPLMSGSEYMRNHSIHGTAWSSRQALNMAKTRNSLHSCWYEQKSSASQMPKPITTDNGRHRLSIS